MSQLYKIQDGEPVISSKGVALLLGVTEEQIRALPIIDGRASIPELWVKRGRRIARENMAHLGTDSMKDLLDHLDRTRSNP